MPIVDASVRFCNMASCGAARLTLDAPVRRGRTHEVSSANHVCKGPEAEGPNVRCRTKTEKDLLFLSVTGFDPSRISFATRRLRHSGMVNVSISLRPSPWVNGSARQAPISSAPRRICCSRRRDMMPAIEVEADGRLASLRLCTSAHRSRACLRASSACRGSRRSPRCTYRRARLAPRIFTVDDGA
jgi:hypothetical protein